MSYIKYGTFDFKAGSGYPVPQISISTEQDRNGAGQVIGSKTIVSLEGLIYTASGTRGFESLTARENGLRNVFQTDGELFQIGCTGAGAIYQTPYFSGRAKVIRYSADKTDNRWLNTIAYNIELQIDSSGNPSSGIFAVSSTQDEINIETIDEFSYANSPYPGIRNLVLNAPFTGYPIYRVSRTLSAVGKYIPSGKSPVANAKEWVFYHTAQNLLTGYLSGLNLYNFTRSVSVNEPDGSYRITDNWLATSTNIGFFTESFNAESSLDNSMLRTVVINGTVKGLETFDTGNNNYLYSGVLGTGVSNSLYPTYSGSRNGNSRFSNALSGYSGIKIGNGLLTRANAFLEPSGYTGSINMMHFGRNEPPLNPIPVSVTEGYNPAEGSVTYSWTYNNRPLNMISGSISEVLTVEDNLPIQQIAEIFVLGRRLGPVLQDLGTFSVPTRNVTFEVVMPRPNSLSGIRFPNNAYMAITGLVESFNPTYLLSPSPSSNTSPIRYAVKSDTENWSISEGRFVKTKQWMWTRCV